MSNIIDGGAAWKVRDLSYADKLDKSVMKNTVPFKFGISNEGDYGYYKGETFMPFVLGQGGKYIGDVIGAQATASGTTVTIKWADPFDIEEDDVTVAAWEGTKVVRKAGSAPENIEDGTLVVDNKTRNQYSSTGYSDTGLTAGPVYYYRFFPYTDTGLMTMSVAVDAEVAGTPITVEPSQSGTLTYNGSEQTVTWLNYDSDQLTLSGTTAGTNAGTYTATFTPKSGYCWSNKSIDPRDITWTIGRATAIAVLSKNSVVVGNGKTSDTVTVTGASGTVSAVSADNTLATVVYENGTATITGVDGASGTTTVNIQVAESTNYNSGTFQIAVNCKFVTIVTWASGSDAAIKAMVEAADAGVLDLTDYWSVGDMRAVSLSAMSATGVGETHVAQTVYYVLVAADSGVEDNTNVCYNYQYVTATSGRSYPSFIVQQKDMLSNGTSGEFGYINATDTNNGSWGSCARKTWCDAVYKPAISSYDLRGIFKQVKVKTAETYNGSTIQESNCYFFLPAAAEVYKGDSTYGQGGTAGQQTAYSNLTEWNALSQWAYYATSANRVKYQGSSGSSSYWWERSPIYSDSQYFCLVTGNGSIYYYKASNVGGIAPSACI